VPELAYLYSLLSQLYATLFVLELETPVALATLGAVVRQGYDSPEKLALAHVRAGRLNRVAVHRQFSEIAPYVTAAQPAASFLEILDRVRRAADLYDL
jgi:hypothetical protein